ncbi:hypothetical protein, partial [Mycobacterium sp.]|uniref:hypothetical protein n=1 Tax=Mycobacterium sp. TaxID=1785 RepID=UPI003A892F64
MDKLFYTNKSDISFSIDKQVNPSTFERELIGRMSSYDYDNDIALLGLTGGIIYIKNTRAANGVSLKVNSTDLRVSQITKDSENTRYLVGGYGGDNEAYIMSLSGSGSIEQSPKPLAMSIDGTSYSFKINSQSYDPLQTFTPRIGIFDNGQVLAGGAFVNESNEVRGGYINERWGDERLE